MDGKYGELLRVLLEDNKLEVQVTSWGQTGGMDSGLSSSDSIESPPIEIPLDAKLLLKVIRNELSSPKNPFLSGYAKPSEFAWQLGYRGEGPKLRGLSLVNVEKTLDYWSMDEDAWEAKWLNQTSSGPNPFQSLNSSSKMKQVADILTGMGFQHNPVKEYVGGDYVVVAQLKSQNKASLLATELEKFADSHGKIKLDFKDALMYKFGGLAVYLARIGRANKWAVFTLKSS